MSGKAEKTGARGLPYRPCAGVVLVNSEGLVFAGQRIDNPGHAWQMPQGGIDKGETVTEAALRELGEETGLTASAVEIVDQTDDWIYYDLPPELLGKVWKGRYCGQRQQWVLMRFLGRNEQVDIATDHPEFDRWCWMRAEDLMDRIVPFKREVYRSVLSAFRDHLA